MISEKEKELLQYIVEQAYKETDDFVSWSWVMTCKGLLEREEDSENDQYGRQV